MSVLLKLGVHKPTMEWLNSRQKSKNSKLQVKKIKLEKNLGELEKSQQNLA